MIEDRSSFTTTGCCVSRLKQPYYCGVGAPDTSAGGGQSRSSKYLKFGHSMTETFECDLKSLLGEEALFYDPYIVDEASLFLSEEIEATWVPVLSWFHPMDHSTVKRIPL